MQTAALINEFDPSGPETMNADKMLKELYIQIKYVASDLSGSHPSLAQFLSGIATVVGNEISDICVVEKCDERRN